MAEHGLPWLLSHFAYLDEIATRIAWLFIFSGMNSSFPVRYGRT